MSRPLQRLQRFFRELKRRNVYKVAVTYGVVAFVVWQAANLLFPALGFPAWTIDFVIVLTLLGFPLALVLAWAFEVTPEGVRRTRTGSSPSEGHEPRREPRTAYKLLIGLGLVGAAVTGGWYLTGGGGGETGPRLGDRSIAVLPFEALGQEEPGAFTAGMHDDLLARLSNISDLKVISRTAVQQYRGSGKTTGEIARELGVRWVLEGGVQEMGNQIQVNAQLIDPRTETHAWAETYRRDLTTENLFAIQSELTKKIARSLEARLTPDETERVERRSTEDLDAYRLYVQGRQRLYRREASPMREAVTYFQRAIRKDSTYALAWAGLADAVSLRSYGYEVPDSVPSAEEAARRALELDPELAEAHTSLGHLYHQQNREVLALRELSRAVELKPSYAQAHHWLGIVYLRLGRPDSALEHLQLATELNPRAWNFHEWLGTAYAATGAVEKALEEARQARRLHTGGNPPWTEVRAHAERGEFGEIRRIAREYRSAAEEPSEAWIAYQGMAEAELGDTARARQKLRELEDGDASGWAGLVHAALGDRDAAFRAFQEAGGPALAVRYFHPMTLGPLREDPRWEELIRQLNEAEGLNPDGSLPDSVDVSFGSESAE